MNKRTVSSKVLLCFFIIMFLVVTLGCSKSDDAAPSAPSAPAGNVTITGTVSGTTIVAIDENNAEQARMKATGTPKTFTITVPIGHTYRFYLIENEETLEETIFPLYSGGTNAFSITSVGTIDFGFVDTTNGVTAIPANNPLLVAGVSAAAENKLVPEIVLGPTPPAGTSLSDLVAGGLSSLQTGGISKAQAYFKAAVTNYPSDTTNDGNTANFFYAVTSVADVNLSSDGTPGDYSSVGDILDNVGCSPGGRGFSNSTMTCPKTLPITTPTGSQLQTFAYNVIAPKLQNALTYLNKVPSTFTRTWTNPIDSKSYKSDYADVLIYKAAIEAALAAINIQYAYNLYANIATVKSSNYTVQQFLTNYSNFLTLSSSASLAVAKTYLSPTTGVDDPFDNLFAAINKIKARSTTGYLINLPTDITTDQINAVKSGLLAGKASLSAQTTVYDKGTPSDTTDDLIINLNYFFAGLNLRSLLPPFTGNNVSGLFPDATMGGVIVHGININADTNPADGIPDILKH